MESVPQGAEGGARPRAGVRDVGVQGVFIEAHDDPGRAPSDKPNMLPLDGPARLLPELRAPDGNARAPAIRA